MIPMMNIIAWGNLVPWADQRQVEQDLIISRAAIRYVFGSSRRRVWLNSISVSMRMSRRS